MTKKLPRMSWVLLSLVASHWHGSSRSPSPPLAYLRPSNVPANVFVFSDFSQVNSRTFDPTRIFYWPSPLVLRGHSDESEFSASSGTLRFLAFQSFNIQCGGLPGFSVPSLSSKASRKM